MRFFGVLSLIAGYCAWYTLYQRTWGDGSGFLYNLTGSTRFGGPTTGSSSTTPARTKGQAQKIAGGFFGGGGGTAQGPPRPPSGQPNPRG